MTKENQKKLVFTLTWTLSYSLIFNGISLSPLNIHENILPIAWVFLLFLVVTYDRLLFFTVVPLVFISSSIVIYAESIMNSPISRDIVISVFQVNWQEISGTVGVAFLWWISGALLLTVLCSLHFLTLKQKHHWGTKATIVGSFVAIFGVTSSVVFQMQENIFSWKHPYDYINYLFSYLKEDFAISELGRNKYNISSSPLKREQVQGELPLQVVLIIGEAARSDHFGINGYQRATTPLLQKEDNLFSFANVVSCGTVTSVSVPCLLTRATRKNLLPSTKETSFISVFNVLGFKTLWVSEQAKFTGLNTVVASIAKEAKETLFQDNNLEVKLNEFKDYFYSELKSSNTASLNIFHMAGSHFPYHWRYPENFRHFMPICPDVLPMECPQEELINSYDNSILFTDYFLSNVIETLRDKNAIMVYISDHGEYLGEHNMYLHGQETEDAELRHVPMIWWTSDRFAKLYPEKIHQMREKLENPLSHDNIFHSILDCAGIDSQVIDKSLSICAASEPKRSN